MVVRVVSMPEFLSHPTAMAVPPVLEGTTVKFSVYETPVYKAMINMSKIKFSISWLLPPLL